MYLSIISGFLSISMVFAGDIKLIKMQLHANNDGQMMTQGVALQYRDNYMKINTEATDDNTQADLIYDTEKGITEYRQADHCFVLSHGLEQEFSTDMDDWYENAEGVKTMRTQDIVLYNYTAVPFCIDRKKIPMVMQEDCDEIYPAVLVNTVRGQRVYNYLEDINTPFETIIFGPSAPDQNANRGRDRSNGRDKRQRQDPLTQIATTAFQVLLKSLDIL